MARIGSDLMGAWQPESCSPRIMRKTQPFLMLSLVALSCASSESKPQRVLVDHVVSDSSPPPQDDVNRFPGDSMPECFEFAIYQHELTLVPRRDPSEIAGCYLIEADGDGARFDGLTIELTTKVELARPQDPRFRTCFDPASTEQRAAPCPIEGHAGVFIARGEALTVALAGAKTEASWSHLSSGHVSIIIGQEGGGFSAEVFCLKPGANQTLTGVRAHQRDVGPEFDVERSSAILKRTECTSASGAAAKPESSR